MLTYYGNKDIMKHQKTAFLCSQTIPADIVMKSYERAVKQKVESNCIICGNHSQIEKDVFEILLKGNQPLILVLACAIYDKFSENITKAIDDGRLLVISPFKSKSLRVSPFTAEIRNKLILKLSDNIYIPYKRKGGMLERITS